MVQIQSLRDYIITASQNPLFLHHEWFVEWHLAIVEKIALELCSIYQEADKNVVLTLVWVHDYGKILDMEKQHKLNHKSKELLLGLNFPVDFVEKTICYLEIMEKKMEIDLKKAPIEVQIVSSADAASHLVGPFMSIYWKEYASKTIQELAQSNIKKLKKDWERKVTIPEIKKTFQDRHNFMLEHAGLLPEKFL